jgi:hypothetical protein
MSVYIYRQASNSRVEKYIADAMDAFRPALVQSDVCKEDGAFRFYTVLLEESPYLPLYIRLGGWSYVFVLELFHVSRRTTASVS